MLLDNGANPNKGDSTFKSSPAYSSALYPKYNSDGSFLAYTEEQLALIDKLVDKGADLTIISNRFTPLQRFSTKLETFALIKYHLTENIDPLKAQLKAYIDSGFNNELNTELVNNLKDNMNESKFEAEAIIREWDANHRNLAEDITGEEATGSSAAIDTSAPTVGDSEEMTTPLAGAES